MKKKLFLSIMLLMFMVASNLVYASGSDSRRLVDEADLIDDKTEEKLADQLDRLAEQYELDPVVVTVEDYRATDPSIYASTPEMFARTYYENGEFGFDEERSGMILLISMAERDWHIYIQGEARVAVNNYGFEYISERLVDQLGNGDYEEAIVRYVADLETFFKEYETGTPYGEDHTIKEPRRILIYLGGAAILSLILAFVVVSVLKSQMNTAKRQYAAREYVKQGSFVLNGQQDLYLYSHTTKTAIPKQTSSGGSSGGGSSSGSRGGSGGGGKF